MRRLTNLKIAGILFFTVAAGSAWTIWNTEMAHAWGGYSRAISGCPSPSDLSQIRSPADLLGEHYSPEENLEAIDVYLLDHAQSTIEIAMYAFTDRPIADAVIRAAARGVHVWIYRDGIQVRDRGDKSRRMLSSGPGQNGLIQIEVKRNSSRNIMHLKAYLIDGTWLRTGSANWSPPGEGAYCSRGRRNHWSQQDNNLFITKDSREIRIFADTFRRVYGRETNRPWNQNMAR